MARPLDSATCSPTGTDMWACGGGVSLDEVIKATSLDLVVTHASAASGPAGSPIPEPSTWAMLALGFLGLRGLGLRKRGRASSRSPLPRAYRPFIGPSFKVGSGSIPAV